MGKVGAQGKCCRVWYGRRDNVKIKGRSESHPTDYKVKVREYLWRPSYTSEEEYLHHR